MFKRTKQSKKKEREASALLKPLNETTDSELIKWLEERGGKDVTLLAPGFISATATHELLEEAKAIAQIEIKQNKRLH